MGKGRDFNLAFGTWLRTELEGLGISGYALSKHAGCHPRTVTMICKGEIKSPSEEMMEKLRIAIDKIKSGLPNQEEEIEEEEFDFAEWLKFQMEAKSLSGNRLAKLVGCHNTTISAILNRRIENPSNEMMERIRNALQEEIPEAVTNDLNEKKKFDNKNDVWDDFNPHDHDSIPNKPGVYVIQPYECCAICWKGTECSFKNRLPQRKKWFLEDIIEYGMLFYSDDENERKKIEDILIKFLRTNAWLNKAGRYKPKRGD